MDYLGSLMLGEFVLSSSYPQVSQSPGLSFPLSSVENSDSYCPVRQKRGGRRAAAVPDFNLSMGPVGEVGANNRGRTRLFCETSLCGYGFLCTPSSLIWNPQRAGPYSVHRFQTKAVTSRNSWGRRRGGEGASMLL
jgi:hypothetical protein